MELFNIFILAENVNTILFRKNNQTQNVFLIVITLNIIIFTFAFLKRSVDLSDLVNFNDVKDVKSILV